ncbi:hypothetical protein N2152v2_004036 [Parachlorella kessleri]
MASQSVAHSTVHCRKAQTVEAADGSLRYRPVLKVKGSQCELGEYNTEREAAIAYDVCKLKVATEHGLNTQTLKLNSEAATYEAHPLFSYLVKECTLDEACRLLREGLVEEFLQQQRPTRQADRRADAAPEAGTGLLGQERGSSESEHSPAELLLGSGTGSDEQQQVPAQQQQHQQEKPQGGVESQEQVVVAAAPSNPPATPDSDTSSDTGNLPRLRSMWREEPAGSGRYLVNVTERLLKMKELCLPAFIRQEMFSEASSGANVTICSASEDDRWLADYMEYSRGGARVDAFLRQLQQLIKDTALQPHDVMAFRRKGRLNLSLEVFPASSQEARAYISSITNQASLPGSAGKPSSASRKRSIDEEPTAEQRAIGVGKKQRSAAGAAAAGTSGKENKIAGGSLKPVATKPAPASAAEPQVLSPRQQQKQSQPMPGKQSKTQAAQPAAGKPASTQAVAEAEAHPGSKGKKDKPAGKAGAAAAAKTPAATAKASKAAKTPASTSKPGNGKPRSSWAQFPLGTGAHSVVLSEAACKNSNLNVTVYRAQQVFGDGEAPSEVTVASVDTGKEYRWTYRKYSSNTNQVYLHALTEYMHAVKADPGDVMSLKYLRKGCAEVTMWKRSSKEAKAFVQHLHSGNAAVTPPPTKAATGSSADKATTQRSSDKKAEGAEKKQKLEDQQPKQEQQAAPKQEQQTKPKKEQQQPKQQPKAAGGPDAAVKPPAAAKPAAGAGQGSRNRSRPASMPPAPSTGEGAASGAALPAKPVEVARGHPSKPAANDMRRTRASSATPATNAGHTAGPETQAAVAAKQPAAAALGGEVPARILAKAAAASMDGPAPTSKAPAPAAVTQRQPSPAPQCKKPATAQHQAAGSTQVAPAVAAIPPAATAVPPAGGIQVSIRQPQCKAAGPKGATTAVGGCRAGTRATTTAVIGTKRRKQASPSRAAEGDPNTAAYADALVPAKRLKGAAALAGGNSMPPGSAAAAEAGTAAGWLGPKKAAGTAVPDQAVPLTTTCPSKPAGSQCSDSMEGDSTCQAAPGGADTAGRAKLLSSTSHLAAHTATTAVTAFSMQSRPCRQQQEQQPLATPCELTHDEAGVWSNMRKLLDLVVTEGRLGLPGAAAFQCGFAQVQDPGARLFYYSGLKSLYDAGEWEQLCTWVSSIKGSQA